MLDILVEHHNLEVLCVQIQILHYIFQQFSLYFLLRLGMLQSIQTFLLVILHIILPYQISFYLHHSFFFLSEYIIKPHDCMHLLFLNSVHHLLQLMEFLIFLLVVSIFDLLILVLLFHCFEFLCNSHLQIHLCAIKLFALLFQYSHSKVPGLLLLLDMHLNKLVLYYIV